MLEEHLYVLGILEDQRDVVVALVAGVLAHVPAGHGAAVDCFAALVYAVISNCPANATFALFVHDGPRLTHGLFPVFENCFFLFSCHRGASFRLFFRVSADGSLSSAHHNILLHLFRHRQSNAICGTARKYKNGKNKTGKNTYVNDRF